jgi:tetratricopeptide (TPR) repeat protein
MIPPRVQVDGNPASAPSAGELPEEVRADSPYEPPPLVLPEWEAPEHWRRAGPLVASLSILVGLSTVVLLLLAFKAREPERPKERVAFKPQAADAVPTSPRIKIENRKPIIPLPGSRAGNVGHLSAEPPGTEREPNEERVDLIYPLEAPKSPPPLDVNLEPPSETPPSRANAPARPEPSKPPAASPRVDDLSKTIAANPSDARAFYQRGDACLAKGDYGHAIKDFNQAIQLDPQFTDAYEKRDLAYKKMLKASPVPGYTEQTIEGFHVLIADSVFGHNNDPVYERKPLDVLKSELTTVSSVLPRRALRALRTIVIWVEWGEEDAPVCRRVAARYYGVSGDPFLWALRENKHPLKANSVEITNMKAVTAEHQPTVKLERCIILHELAHGVHFQLFGANNVQIKLAYRQAMDRKLYDSSRDVDKRPIRPYASTNEYEYFAELSCAYFNKLNYFPFNREELRKYDPTGYRMMELTWGKAK